MQTPLISARTVLVILAGWMAPFSQTTAKAAYRVNCGGEAYTDPQGNVWQADGHFAGGSLWSTASGIDGTDSDPLYQTERWNDPAMGTLTYTFPVEAGPHTVRLHFAEISLEGSMEGARVFDIALNGETRLTEFEVFKAAGSANRAIVKELLATPVDGVIKVEFHNRTHHAKISAIEVLAGEPSSVKPSFRISVPSRPAIRSPGPGALSILPPFAGAYRVILRTSGGRELASRRAAGRTEQIFSGLAAGVCLVEVRSGNSLEVGRVALLP